MDEFLANFMHKFKYEIHTNLYEFFARKIGYVTNGLYCISDSSSFIHSFISVTTLSAEKQVRNYSEFTRKRIAKKTGP